MSVEFRGFEEIQKRLQQQLSEKNLQKITDKALLKGSEVVKKEVLQGLETFEDSGATIDELTVGKPISKKGYRMVKLGWNGPEKRYQLVHLNEFGYKRNGKRYGKDELKGFGQLEKAVSNSKQKYFDAVREEMKKHL